MDIQAYFEEWSRQPGDIVRLAISTPHKSVRASLVRLVSGPGQGDHIEGRVTDFSSVLDSTIPGRVQPTMIGSYAEFPLPAPIKDGAISLPLLGLADRTRTGGASNDLVARRRGAGDPVGRPCASFKGSARWRPLPTRLLPNTGILILITLGNGEALDRSQAP